MKKSIDTIKRLKCSVFINPYYHANNWISIRHIKKFMYYKKLSKCNNLKI